MNINNDIYFESNNDIKLRINDSEICTKCICIGSNDDSELRGLREYIDDMN